MSQRSGTLRRDGLDRRDEEWAMGFVGEIWRVLRGRELAGEITIEETDFPGWPGVSLPARRSPR
nr:hypothetical protein GCM10020093_095780 [Planobispora longispora]